MAIVGWHKTSGAPLHTIRVQKAQDKWMADIPVSVFEICMVGSNKSGPVSIFYPELTYSFIASGSVLNFIRTFVVNTSISNSMKKREMFY